MPQCLHSLSLSLCGTLLVSAEKRACGKLRGRRRRWHGCEKREGGRISLRQKHRNSSFPPRIARSFLGGKGRRWPTRGKKRMEGKRKRGGGPIKRGKGTGEEETSSSLPRPPQIYSRPVFSINKELHSSSSFLFLLLLQARRRRRLQFPPFSPKVRKRFFFLFSGFLEEKKGEKGESPRLT